MKLDIHIKADDTHQDSFWFDGLVAETEDYSLVATGEIKIFRGQELVYDGKSRGSGFDPQEDKDLPQNDNEALFFDSNNWFEVYGKEDGSTDQVYDTYNEAVVGLMLSQFEKDRS